MFSNSNLDPSTSIFSKLLWDGALAHVVSLILCSFPTYQILTTPQSILYYINYFRDDMYVCTHAFRNNVAFSNNCHIF